MSKFQKATRKKAKLRFGIDGPSGSGKTYTALRLAYALGEKVAVIDTESGSASKYQGETQDEKRWDFDACELVSFSPAAYTAAIEEAGRAGYDVLVIDSLSHAWQGKDGALEMVDRAKAGGNAFAAWRNVTPLQNAMVQAILTAPLHVIATMRSKTEYVVEKDDRGKSTPRKVGLAPVQRDGIEYEFDIYGSLDHEHVLRVTKTRCSRIDGASVMKPGAAFMAPVLAWLAGNDAPAEPPTNGKAGGISPEQAAELKAALKRFNTPQADFLSRFGVKRFGELPAEKFQDAKALASCPMDEWKAAV